MATTEDRYTREFTTELQNYLFPEGLPKWMRSFSTSPELMTIFYMLYLDTAIETAVLNKSTTIDVILHQLMCAETRDVITYKVIEDFKLDIGYLQRHIDLPRYETEARLRSVKKGNLILARIDNKLNTMELQILRDGLFGADSPAIFTIDNNRFSDYHKFVVRERYKDERGL